MKKNSDYIPVGFQSVTPYLTFKDTKKALAFYENALGATILEVLPMPDGKGTMHATMKIGNSILMMGDEMPDCPSAETQGGSSISLFVYVPDVDTAFKQAINAGATETMPVMDMFWGDRCGNLTDPFGYSWMIGTHKRDLTPEEIQEGAKEFFNMRENQ